MNKQIKILIVDDSQEWINFHQNALVQSFENISVSLAYSAREGFNKAISENFDIIISDMEMESVFDERYAGMWLIKQLKSLNDKVHIIAVSGAYDIKEIASSLKVDYIPKPDLITNPLLFKYKITELLDS